jgi:excisionase family DNA binding protein
MPRDNAGRQPPLGETDWLTLGQAARYLGVAQSTIRKVVRQRPRARLQDARPHRRYRRDDLDAFLQRSAPESHAGPIVLIVDDDERLREYVRVNLEMEGYTVHEAGSAEDGMKVLDELRPTSCCST